MIDRKASLISCALLVLMLAATAWRLALLSDWTHFPAFLPDKTAVMRSSFWLLVAPLCLVFVGGTLALNKRRVKESPDAIHSWTRWGSSLLIIYGVICAALQFFILARSLGLALAINPTNFGRAALVLLACLIVVSANYMPKLPLVQSRFTMLNLDPARGAQFVRFSARMLVLAGIAIIVIAVFVPQPSKGVPWIFSISAAVVVVSFLRRWQLSREYRDE